MLPVVNLEIQSPTGRGVSLRPVYRKRRACEKQNCVYLPPAIPANPTTLAQFLLYYIPDRLSAVIKIKKTFIYY
jgi:hypothetical protein